MRKKREPKKFLTRTMAATLATIAMLVTVGTVLAANWYYSRAQTFTINGYAISVNNIPAVLNASQPIQIYGNVTDAGAPVANAPVYLFINGTQQGSYVMTDSTGFYNMTWVVTGNPGDTGTLTMGISA